MENKANQQNLSGLFCVYCEGELLAVATTKDEAVEICNRHDAGNAMGWGEFYRGDVLHIVRNGQTLEVRDYTIPYVMGQK